MRVLGDIRWFLNIRVLWDRTNRTVWLCQDAYIDKMAHDYNINPLRKVHTPLSGSTIGPFDGKATPMSIYGYQRHIGSLIYIAVATCPDIAASVSILARHLTNPSEAHLAEADHIITYLNTTKGHAIQYGPGSMGSESNPRIHILEASSDASYADAPGRTSTEGYIFSLFGGPIDWCSNR